MKGGYRSYPEASPALSGTPATGSSRSGRIHELLLGLPEGVADDLEGLGQVLAQGDGDGRLDGDRVALLAGVGRPDDGGLAPAGRRLVDAGREVGAGLLAGGGVADRDPERSRGGSGSRLGLGLGRLGLGLGLGRGRLVGGRLSAASSAGASAAAASSAGASSAAASSAGASSADGGPVGVGGVVVGAASAAGSAARRPAVACFTAAATLSPIRLRAEITPDMSTEGGSGGGGGGGASPADAPWATSTSTASAMRVWRATRPPIWPDMSLTAAVRPSMATTLASGAGGAGGSGGGCGGAVGGGGGGPLGRRLGGCLGRRVGGCRGRQPRGPQPQAPVRPPWPPSGAGGRVPSWPWRPCPWG